MNRLLRCVGYCVAQAADAVLSRLFPAHHIEVNGPRALCMFEAEGEVLESGAVLVTPDPALCIPGTAEWSPFDDTGHLRTEELANEGWHIVGTMKEE